MSEKNSPADAEPQSFVVRVWTEEPGRWRGKVSYVQGNVHKGFTRLIQALEFMEQRLGPAPKEASRPSPRRSALGRPFQIGRLPRRTLRLAGAMVSLAILAGGALLLSMPSGGGSLAGAAAGGGLDMAPVLLFAAGALAGATATALWRTRSVEGEYAPHPQDGPARRRFTEESNMIRRIFRRPWSLAVLVAVVILLAAAVLVAQPGEGSLFGVTLGGGFGKGCVPLFAPCPRH